MSSYCDTSNPITRIFHYLASLIGLAAFAVYVLNPEWGRPWFFMLCGIFFMCNPVVYFCVMSYRERSTLAEMSQNANDVNPIATTSAQQQQSFNLPQVNQNMSETNLPMQFLIMELTSTTNENTKNYPNDDPPPAYDKLYEKL